eukprot:scpid58879/ scgid22569/ 
MGPIIAFSILLCMCTVTGTWSLTCNDLDLICSGTQPREVPWTVVSANIPSFDGSAYNWNYAGATTLPLTSSISCEDRSDHLLITSAGIPSNASYVGKFPFRTDTTGSGHGDNPNTMAVQTYEWKIPKTPVIKATAPPQATGSNGELQYGPIAFALDGVPFFNPFNNQRQDAVDPTSGGYEVMDLCFGHPTMTGAYHHHYILPRDGCLFQDTPGQHSPKIGYAFDGIPIYGPQSDNGLAPTDLDVCNGRTHPTLGYIYHTTNNTYPYTFGCYRYQTIRQRMISGTLVATGTGPGVKGTMCSPKIGVRASVSTATGSTSQPVTNGNVSATTSAAGTNGNVGATTSAAAAPAIPCIATLLMFAVCLFAPYTS